MDDGLHVGISGIVDAVIETQVVFALAADACLVEDAQHLVEPVVDTAVETGNLHEDAVVVETVDKAIGDALRHGYVIIVERLMAHVDHGFFYLADGMPQQVDGHHRQCVTVGTVGNDVAGVLVVYAQVLSEAEGLRGEPCLLEFHQYELFLTVALADGGPEIDAEDGEHLLLAVGVLMGPDFNFHYILLQQCRENGTGYAFVLHEVLEHGVVNRVGNRHHNLAY